VPGVKKAAEAFRKILSRATIQNLYCFLLASGEIEGQIGHYSTKHLLSERELEFLSCQTLA